MTVFDIFLSVVILTVPSTTADLLRRVLGNIDPHREVFTVIADEDDVPHPFASTFQYASHRHGEKYSGAGEGSQSFDKIREGIHIVFQSTDDVAIVVSMKSESSTYQVMQIIGNETTTLRDVRRIWTIVIWPFSINSSEEIGALRGNKEYIEATYNFIVNSQLFIAFNISTPGITGNTALYEAYRAANFTALREMDKGLVQWNCSFCEGVSLRRFNFHRRILKVTAVNDTEVNDDIQVYVDSNGTVRYSKGGFSGSMLEVLQNLLNFTAEPMLSKGFGSPIPGTKRWAGSIGDVSEGVADLAISVTIFQPDRASVVSFLPPADEHQIHSFFKPPHQNSVRDVFAQPFKGELWLAVLTTWIVLASCMVIFSKIRKRYGMDEYERLGSSIDEKPEPDFARDSLIWAIGTACQQGWEDHPKAISLRALFISGSFTGVVAYAGYSAAIVSSLSLRIDPIQTPLQLLGSSLDVGIRQGFISCLLEQNKSRDTMSKFYKKVEQSPPHLRYINISTGLNRILNEPYAYITTRDTIYDLMKTNTDDKVICGIKDLPILKYGFPIGYPIPKFSPYREILRYALTMNREPGVLYRLRMKYAFERRCVDTSKQTYALGPADVFTALMILTGGFAISLTLLVVERCFTIGRIKIT